MTDGERLVWSATFALTFERHGDGVLAARAAAGAVVALRAVMTRDLGADDRQFLDEIVNIP